MYDIPFMHAVLLVQKTVELTMTLASMLRWVKQMKGKTLLIIIKAVSLRFPRR